MKDLEKVAIYGALAGAGVFLLYIMTRGVKGAASDIAGGVVSGAIDAVAGTLNGAYNALPEQIKPSSDQNIIYQGINGIGSTVTGDKYFTLGGWIYDKTH